MIILKKFISTMFLIILVTYKILNCIKNVNLSNDVIINLLFQNHVVLILNISKHILHHKSLNQSFNLLKTFLV